MEGILRSFARWTYNLLLNHRLRLPTIPSSSDRAKNIASGIRSLTIQNFLTSVLAFVFLAILLRLLPASEYGVYAAVVLTFGIANVLASFGFSTAATRFLALLRETDEKKARSVVKSILVLTLLSSFVMSVLFFVISPNLSFFFTGTSEWTFVFALGAIWVFSATIASTALGFVQGLKKYNQMAMLLLIARVVLLMFTTAGLYFFHTLEIPILGWILYSTVIIVWSLKLTGDKLILSKGDHEYSEVLRYSVPSGVATMVNTISSNADQAVVGGYLGTIPLGIYSAAVNISNVLALVFVTPLITAFLPETSSSVRNPYEVSNGLKLALRFSVAAIVPVSFIVSGLASQLLILFSGRGVYLAGALSLQTLSTLFIFSAIAGILNSLLLAVGRTIVVLIIGITTVLTDIGLSIILVPLFGIEGAALANACVGIIGFFVALPFCRQYLTGLKREYRFYTKVIIGSTASLLVILALNRFVSDEALTIIPYSILAMVIYFGCLRLSKAFTDEDKNYLNHFIPFPMNKMADYL